MQATAPASTLERQGTHALLTTGISVALGLLLSVILARTLGPAGKGLLDLTSATAALFTLVLGGSLNSALTHFVARAGSTPAGVMGQLAVWAAGAGLIAALCLGWRPELSTRLGLLPAQEQRFWTGFIVVIVAFGVWAVGLRGILIGQHAVITVNRIDVAIKTALFLGYGGLAAAVITSPRAFAWVGLATAVALPAALLLAHRGRTGPAENLWPTLMAIALPVHGTNVLHFVNQRADLFFVQAFHGAGEVGLYALAVSLAQCVLLLSSALAQPLLPQISAAKSPLEAAHITAQICRRFMALGLPAALALAFGSTWLLPVVFGRDFAGSLPPLLMLLPGMLAFGLTNILISFFVGVDRSRANLWISLGALAVTVVGNAWLTRRHGAIGAAATSSLAYTLAGGVSVWLFARLARISICRVIVPAAADWRAAFALVGQFRF